MTRRGVGNSFGIHRRYENGYSLVGFTVICSVLESVTGYINVNAYTVKLGDHGMNRSECFMSL